MNINSIPHHTFPSVGYAISAAKDGRMSLPVSPSAYIYSHFKHVSGFPAPEGTTGVNISRLKILDTLIDRLTTLKNQPSADFGLLGSESDKRIDALIEQYQKQIQTMLATGSATPYGIAAPATGLLFNITA